MLQTVCERMEGKKAGSTAFEPRSCAFRVMGRFFSSRNDQCQMKLKYGEKA